MSPHDQVTVALTAIFGAGVAIGVFILHLQLHFRVRRLEAKLREHGVYVPY